MRMLQGRPRNCRQNDGTEVAEELGAMRRLLTISIVVAALTGFSAVPARHNSAGHQKLDLALGRAAIAARADVRTLIRVSPGTGARVAERLAASGIFVTSSTTPNLYLAKLPRPRLSIVTSDPDVVRVSLDAPVRALGTLSSLPQNLLLGTQALLPRTYTGKNIGVAVVDSGFLTSADLGNVTASYDFTSGKTVKAGPKDAFGHGTHVSGLIGSTGDTTRGLYQGIAPGVRFIVLKALDQAGVGYTSNVINAINFAVANKVVFGIDVMNLSLGHPIYEPAGDDPLVAAVERAVSAGIVVVVSAGNFGGDPVTHEVGYAGITSPGNAPDRPSLGATIRSRGTAPAARPGTTATRNPTSWRQDHISRRT
jgi:subtilisin family serine protease